MVHRAAPSRPRPAQAKWAAALSLPTSAAELVASRAHCERLEAAVLEQMAGAFREAKFAGFEFVRRITLDAEPWTPENGAHLGANCGADRCLEALGSPRAPRGRAPHADVQAEAKRREAQVPAGDRRDVRGRTLAGRVVGAAQVKALRL